MIILIGFIAFASWIALYFLSEADWSWYMFLARTMLIVAVVGINIDIFMMKTQKVSYIEKCARKCKYWLIGSGGGK